MFDICRFGEIYPHLIERLKDSGRNIPRGRQHFCGTDLACAGVVNDQIGKRAPDIDGYRDRSIAAVRDEPRSKVTFALEPMGEKVKLTVTHDGFPPGSRVVQMVDEGCPVLLSDLKSLLETGEILPA